jgi:RNA polymerase sigma-70 factor (sigma-E family)
MTDSQTRFLAFVAERQRSLLRFATVLTGDPHLAEDICAEVISTVYERWDKIEALDRLDAYVRRMVVNEFASRRRRLARFASLSIHSIPDEVEPDNEAVYVERQEMVTRLAALPPRQRAAIVLRFYEGLTDSDIAAALGCSTGTVRSHISRALKTLRLSTPDANDFPARPKAAMKEGSA